MIVVQHLWELILFLIIFISPIPLCLYISFEHQKENSNYSLAHFLVVVLTGWSILQVSTGLILGSCDRLDIYSIILAEFAIVIFGLSLIYYKKSGINAVLALLLNTVILMAALSYFNATLIHFFIKITQKYQPKSKK